MQKLQGVRPKKDIEAANRPFAEKHSDNEFPEIDSKNATHVANQVRRDQWEKTPREDDDHGIALEHFLQFLHSRSVFSFEHIIEMQGFGKIVDTHG
jgi:hypothetical protein